MTVGNAKIFGLPDFCSLPAVTIEAGSEASADYPASNLKTEVPSDTWRSDGYGFLDTHLKASALFEGGIIEFSMGGFGLVNHNLWPWSGDVRFIAGEGATPPEVTDLWDVLVPTSILASTNLAGSSVIGDIDNGFTPDGNAFLPSSLALSSYGFRLAMPAPSGDLAIGADKQAFYLYAKLASAVSPTVSPSEAPTMKVNLWKSGVLIAELATKAVCTAEFQWFIFRWDADLLNDITGTGVQVEVVCSINGTPTPERRIAVDELLWLCERENAVSSGPGILHDSGWLPAGTFVPNPRGTAKYVPFELTQGDCIAHDVRDVATVVDNEIAGVYYFRVLIREDHSPDLSIYNVVTFPITPPGYVEAGKLVVGGAVFSTEVNFATGPLDGIKDLTTVAFTKGGQQYGDRSGTLRTAVLDFPALTQQEKAFISDRILRRRGRLRPLLVVLTPGDQWESETLSIYATIGQSDTVASTQTLKEYRRRLTLNLVEHR